MVDSLSDFCVTFEARERLVPPKMNWRNIDCYPDEADVFWYTLIKRISHWPLYKIWYHATYVINASTVWLLCIVHTDISINVKKKRFHVQNCPCRMVGANNGHVLGLLVHGKVVVEFGRKVFLVDCLHYNENMLKISITERVQAFSCKRKLQV